MEYGAPGYTYWVTHHKEHYLATTMNDSVQIEKLKLIIKVVKGRNVTGPGSQEFKKWWFGPIQCNEMNNNK